jgi:hypothetical protein
VTAECRCKYPAADWRLSAFAGLRVGRGAGPHYREFRITKFARLTA